MPVHQPDYILANVLANILASIAIDLPRLSLRLCQQYLSTSLPVNSLQEVLQAEVVLISLCSIFKQSASSIYVALAPWHYMLVSIGKLSSCSGETLNLSQ